MTNIYNANHVRRLTCWRTKYKVPLTCYLWNLTFFPCSDPKKIHFKSTIDWFQRCKRQPVESLVESVLFRLGYPQAQFMYVDHHRLMTYWPTVLADGKIWGLGWQLPKHAPISVSVAGGSRGKQDRNSGSKGWSCDFFEGQIPLVKVS